MVLQDYEKCYIQPATTNYVVTSVLPANGALTIAHQPDFPRNLTITVTSSTITAGLVTITGQDYKGWTITDTLDLSGGYTKTGTTTFYSITSITLSGLANVAGTDRIIIGIGTDIQLTRGNSTLESVIISNLVTHVGSVRVIDGSSGQTANVATLKQDIAAKCYRFDAKFGTGIRIYLDGDTPIVVTYYQ